MEQNKTEQNSMTLWNTIQCNDQPLESQVMLRLAGAIRFWKNCCRCMKFGKMDQISTLGILCWVNSITSALCRIHHIPCSRPCCWSHPRSRRPRRRGASLWHCRDWDRLPAPSWCASRLGMQPTSDFDPNGPCTHLKMVRYAEVKCGFWLALSHASSYCLNMF